MVHIRPFKASYYRRDQDLSLLVSPPYDVISPVLQNELYQRHPFNFVRVDYGKTETSDSENSNAYTRSAQTLQEWFENKVFTQAESLAYYVHTQDFQLGQTRQQRSDLFVLCEAAPYETRQVLAHEKTLEGPKADRFKLMQATQSHMSPVFSLYSDPDQTILQLTQQSLQNEPVFEFTDTEGLHHSLHVITDPVAIEQITQCLAKQSLYIADGHHRYDTALKFSREYGETIPAANYLCMYLSAIQDPGLCVLPYHRLIRSHFKWPDSEHWLPAAKEYFEIKAIAASDIQSTLAQTPAGKMGFVMQNREQCLYFEREAGLPAGLATHRQQAYRQLDVSVLHELLLYQLVDFPSDKSKDPEFIQFSPDIQVLQETLEREGGVAFYVNATPVQALCEIADQGETMPPKSTYFYPKVPSGLLFARFDSCF